MRRWISGLVMAGLVGLAPLAQAQAARTFKTHLSPVPVAAYNPVVVGTGTVIATLTGNKLAIAGTYEGLASRPRRRSCSRARSPASVATRCWT